jgi:hypothetical protein
MTSLITFKQEGTYMTPKKIILSKEPEWYFKVIGMLQHNYAFIHEESNGNVFVYFCHENGGTLNRIPSNMDSNAFIKERLPCIVDSLEFPNILFAQYALKINHFNLISVEGQNESFDLDGCPTGKEFFDMREYESGIYSKQDKYWIKSDFEIRN